MLHPSSPNVFGKSFVGLAGDQMFMSTNDGTRYVIKESHKMTFTSYDGQELFTISADNQRPGKHTLMLEDANGSVLCTIHPRKNGQLKFIVKYPDTQ